MIIGIVEVSHCLYIPIASDVLLQEVEANIRMPPIDYNVAALDGIIDPASSSYVLEAKRWFSRVA